LKRAYPDGPRGATTKGKQEPKKEQIREPLLSAPPPSDVFNRLSQDVDAKKNAKKTKPGNRSNIYELSDAEKQLIKYRLGMK